MRTRAKGRRWPRLLLNTAGLLPALALALVGLTLFQGVPAAQADSTTITVGDLWFCDSSFQGGVCETTIAVGDTVTWDYASGNSVHTTTECGTDCDSPTDTPPWDSGNLSPGDDFSFTFDTAGTYLYRCDIHPQVMRGKITVQEAASPTPMATPAVTPTATPMATPTVVASPPATAMPTTPAPTPTFTPIEPPTTGAGGTQGSSDSPPWLPIAVGTAAVALSLGGGLFLLRRRS